MDLPEQATWPWPFARAELTSGLRRHLRKPDLALVDVRPVAMQHQRPSIGRVRGLRVDFQAEGEAGACSLVVKEPRGATRAGLAGAGRREVGMYTSLATELPVEIPALIAAAPNGDWLVLEAVRPLRRADRWRADDYWRAVRNLVALHERFWGLRDDLDAFPWLGRPLEADFAVHVTAAAQAIERIVTSGKPEALASRPERVANLAQLTAQADRIARPLLDQPATLLHGDYWPGNIAAAAEGRQIVFDWQMASVGPAVLDLFTFVTKSQWWFGQMPVEAEEIVERYRTELAERAGESWTNAEWIMLWDHARLWRFLQEWVDLLAAMPDALLNANTQALERVWLEPVAGAVAARLGGG
jgi:Phosphotransferase enzyme family